MITDLAEEVGMGQKIIEADAGILKNIPAIKSRLSFHPFVTFLKEKLPASTGLKREKYLQLISQFEEHPELLSPFDNFRLLEEHSHLIELLSTSIFPVVGEEDENVFSLAFPYQFKIFSASDAFIRLFTNAKEGLLLPGDMTEEQLKTLQCHIIYDHVLEKFYGIRLNENDELLYTVVVKETGLRRHYRIRYDRRFIEVRIKGTLPPIHECGVCLNTFRMLNLEQQMERMPLDLFEVEGFAVWTAEDVTTSKCVNAVKKLILHNQDCDSDTIGCLKKEVQSLIGFSDIEVGLMPFTKMKGQYVLDEDCTQHSLVGKHWKSYHSANETDFSTYVEFINADPQPIAVPNFSAELLEPFPFFRDIIHEYKSYISYPLQNDEGTLGLLEIGANEPGKLNKDVLARLEPIIPFLSLALLKNRSGFNNRIEKIIKEKFTALQPSVEWKFEEVAWKFMKSNAAEGDAGRGNVVFDEVYPLYGAVDIRNSSLQRNLAIQKDLKVHLGLVNDTLAALNAMLSLPLLEGLQFKSIGLAKAIAENFSAEDENRINEFFENEMQPVLNHLQKSNSQAQPTIEKYFKALKNNEGELYHHRKDYEHSMNVINDAVLNKLAKQEEKLQQSYPHYFEKYRTDGVEYNIYIGQSIAPNHPFDLLYLKNIRLWQLQSMSELARLTNDLLPELNCPLQTTQLILVHSQPISISFRRDERRFDVEGSYNIRYEVIKKRLDKVRIKETGERLTQVGKIAIVYSNPKEAQEYEEYIGMLQSKNVLTPSLETLELEELQGIRGLKALRVTINLDQ